MAAGVLLALPASAQPVFRVGTEFRANTHTQSFQNYSAVAMDHDGDFVVVWQSAGQDGDQSGVFGQRFNAGGVPQAVEFQVNAYTPSYEGNPALALDADGDFVVVWIGYDGGGDVDVFARRFTSAGAPSGAIFQVNAYASGTQFYARVGMDDVGDFVVVWSGEGDGSGNGVFGRRFNSSGLAQGVEFQVNTLTLFDQLADAVAMDAAGDFVVTWTRYDGVTQDHGIFARRFASSGAPQGGQFPVNAFSVYDQRNSVAAMSADGRFVVAWQSLEQDGGGQGIFARRFGADGSALAVEFQVTTRTFYEQSHPAVAMVDSGAFVVAWETNEQVDGSYSGVFGRGFDPDGNPVGSELQINSFTLAGQVSPALASDHHGRYVVTWLSNGQDGDGPGVFGNRFKALGILDVDGDGVTAPLTDGLLVLRFFFGFTGATLTSGAVDLANCTRCSAAAIEAYLRGDPGSGAPGLASRQAVRLGGEFQVNTYTPSTQAARAVAMASSGDFVVIWTSYAGQDGSLNGVFGRRFTSAGAALSSEFQINTYTTNVQSRPAIGMAPGGAFVVAWESTVQDNGDYGVFGRRFNAAGAPQAAEFQINAYTPGIQSHAVAAMRNDGGFVTLFDDSGLDGPGGGVFGRRFDPAGVAQGATFHINSYATSIQTTASVGMDAGGAFVVAWSSVQDGGGYGVFARRFDSSGAALASEFQVNTYTVNAQRDAAVTVEGDGDFVVVWSSVGQDGSSYGAFGRRFDSAGSPRGGELAINRYTADSQRFPRVGIDGAGRFVVVWSSYGGQDGSDAGVFARQFGADGAGAGADFQVNTYTGASQNGAVIAMNDGGRFVVAWSSGHDAGTYGVFAQRFLMLDPFDLDGNGTVAPLTDGLLALRFLFGFTGSTLVTGAVDTTNCTRCDAPAITAYLQGLL